ncbi:hypothetical protein KI387_017768 [Taxus chinensis]|uniref:Transmembrane protein 209 n=1 Tax=Taxus chinensis TaxID=29808 RepID=A0AA38GK88_TAXCH|nr:hypothetical protein KI387_017768 [Taxus chinensis]
MADRGSPLTNQPKFMAYENPAIANALSAVSLRPTRFNIVAIVIMCFASALLTVGLIFWEEVLIEVIASLDIFQSFAYVIAKIAELAAGLAFLSAMSALHNALSLQSWADSTVCVLKSHSRDSPAKSKSNQATSPSGLTEHQHELLGLRKRNVELGDAESPSDVGSRQKPPRSRQRSNSSPSTLLAPVHKSASRSLCGLGPGQSQWTGLERRDVGIGKVLSFPSPVANRSPGSQGTPYISASPISQISGQTSPSRDKHLMTPWSKQRSSLTKDDIPTEEKLQEFLADVEEKMKESASKTTSPLNQALATPSPTIRGVGSSSPGSVASGSISGTPRTTPLRSVRLSPSTQKFSTSPKKGEGDLPPPMSMEQSIEAFQNLGVYPHIEQWRDRLRQWFSEVLLNPLVQKISISHIQVMQATAKLGIPLTITQVGNNIPDSGVSAATSSDNTANEWHTTYTLDEDSVLHQLRATLIQARDAPPIPQPSLLGLQPPKEIPFNPVIQECLDAVTEHQRLRALMKGEWVKGLLPAE